MATELLQINTTATPSTDFTISEGSQKTLVLKSNATNGLFPNAQVYLQIKDDSGKYWTVETLSSHNPAIIVVSPGTYRFLRKAGGSAVGVFSA